MFFTLYTHFVTVKS